MSIEYILTSLVVILLPGTGVLYTLAIGMGKGFKPSILAALGCTLGIVPAALASVAGLAAVLHASALAFEGLKYLGVAYLLYMAWNILREDGALNVSADATETASRDIVLNGTLLNILNPKLSLFFMAFFPQFAPVDAANTTMALVLLALTFMLLTFVVFIGYGACASVARDYVMSRPTVLLWLRRSFACTFGFLGLRLFFSER
jgi:threonine/homoserine/homoserine lactone efflux protein